MAAAAGDLQGALVRGEVAVLVGKLLSHSACNLRLDDGRTLLMAATTYPDPAVALRLVDVLLEHGADLLASDGNKRHVLMHACYHGASVNVIKRILKTNKERGGWQLSWTHRDDNGLDAVVLASHAGHGKLAAYLLDHVLDIAVTPIENYPLKVLETALEADDDACALDVLKSAVMQQALKTKADAIALSRNPWKVNCTVYSCVDAAVKSGQVKPIEHMIALNHEDPARAVWYSLSRRGAAFAATPAIRKIGDQYWHDLMWSSVRPFVLLRHRGRQVCVSTASTLAIPTSRRSQSWFQSWFSPLQSKNHKAEAELGTHLAALPDAVFSLMLQFLLPKADNELETTRLWLDARLCRRCDGLCIPNECRAA